MEGRQPPYQHLPGLKRWPGIRTLETWSFLPAYLLLLIRTLGAILFSLGCSRATKLCTLPNIWIKGCGRCLSSLPMGAPSSPLPSRPPGAHRAWLLGVRLCNRSRGGFVRRHRRLLVSDCGSAGRYRPRGGSGQVGVAGASRQPAAGSRPASAAWGYPTPPSLWSIATHLGIAAKPSGTIFLFLANL